MQAFVCNSEGIPMADTMLTIQVGGASGRAGGRGCLSPVELGKRLLVYSRDGDTEEVRNLISRGAPFTTDWLGTSPLHLAAQMGHTETAEVLLRGGISRDARTKVDRTPLHIAAQEGHSDLVDLLLSHGADVDATDMLRMTPLHWAVERGHTECVLKLLEHGANPNCVSKFDKSPIIIAIDQNRVDLLDVLQNSEMYMQKEPDDPAHFMSQLDEADSAAENLVVELSSEQNLVHQEEEVQTSHVGSVQAGYDSKTQSIKINYLNSGDKAKARKTVVTTGASTSAAQSNIQFLKAHGITMLPADDSSLVASAMESGQTVVLTEAGKLALNQTKSPGVNKKMFAAAAGKSQRKVVTISSEQLAALTGAGKVTKIVPVKKSGSPAPSTVKVTVEEGVSRVITTTTGKRVFPSSSGVQVVKSMMDKEEPGPSLPTIDDSNDDEKCGEEDVRLASEEVKEVGKNGASGSESGVEKTDSQDGQFVKVTDKSEDNSSDVAPPEDDLESMSKKLAKAKQEADECRKQLLQKEQEAAEYMKKLQSLSK